jgi:metabolite-proton symporter
MNRSLKAVQSAAIQQRPMAKIAFASFIGTTIEYYDFYIYGLAAALVFPALFFPKLDPASGLLASFATYGVAFLARPLGGAIFGHFGDRVGRKTMLVISLLLMGVSTVLIGLLPTYDAIGVLAPILLIVLRFLQGVGLGGEWAGAVLMAAEHAPPHKRAFYAGFPQLGPTPAYLLSAGIFLLLVSMLEPAQFAGWGWRIPFLLSIVLVGVGLFIRLKLAETPAFRKVIESRTEARVPLWDVLRAHPKTVLLAAGAGSVIFCLFYIVTVFSISYGVNQLGLPQATMLYCVMVAVVFMGFGIFFFATISDRIGRRNLSLLSVACMGVWAFPMFRLVDTGNPILITLAFTVGMVAWSAMYGPMGAFFSELFPARVRYSGCSLSFALAGVVGGALAPITAVRLLSATGTSSSVALYVFAMAMVSFVCLMFLPETDSGAPDAAAAKLANAARQDLSGA